MRTIEISDRNYSAIVRALKWANVRCEQEIKTQMRFAHDESLSDALRIKAKHNADATIELQDDNRCALSEILRAI